MKLAVSNIAWDAPEDDAVKAALRAGGVHGIEVAPTKFWPDWEGMSVAAATAERQRLADSGFAVPALQAILFGRPDLQVFGDEASVSALVAHIADVAAVAAAITPDTRAIIPVHLFGQMADMDPIMALAETHDLIVIEDAAQAIGAHYKGRPAGSIGHYGCFSFFPSKNLGGFGDGGMVTTTSDERIDRLRWYRNHGANPKYYHSFVGGNFRLDAIQAAVLSVKLRHLDDWHRGRQENADTYRKLFAEHDPDGRIGLPVAAETSTRHIYNQFCLRIPQRRDAVWDGLKAAGVGSEVYYPVPLHMQRCFADLGYKQGDCPHAELAANEALAIPIYPELTDAQLTYVVEQVTQL